VDLFGEGAYYYVIIVFFLLPQSLQLHLQLSHPTPTLPTPPPTPPPIHQSPIRLIPGKKLMINKLLKPRPPLIPRLKRPLHQISKFIR